MLTIYMLSGIVLDLGSGESYLILGEPMRGTKGRRRSPAEMRDA